jgi:hypothetical protein
LHMTKVRFFTGRRVGGGRAVVKPGVWASG